MVHAAGTGKRGLVALALLLAFSMLSFLWLTVGMLVSGYRAPISGMLLPGGTQKPALTVVLTFDVEDTDDGNETVTVPGILQVLDAHGAKGTFFITGMVAERYPGLVRQISDAGHEIGLHTYEHHFPIFDRAQASAVASAFRQTTDYIWARSFATESAFGYSIERNREALAKAAGNGSYDVFRAPSLVSRWSNRTQYFAALRSAGIKIDSSMLQEFMAVPSPPAKAYEYNGIIEVPVTRGRDILKPGNFAIIRKLQQSGAPLVIFIHPKEASQEDIAALDSFLTGIEQGYEVNYATVGEIARSYTAGHGSAG